MLGRGEEMVEIEAFLGAANAGSRALLVAGEIGIGKTTLWESGRAAADGFRVLTARAVESETPLDFAGLADLLDQVDEKLVEALPGPQRRALQVALLREEAGEPPPDQRSVATATLGVLRALAAREPVLVAIDDLQWLDPATGRVLAFALRRLDTQAVLALVAARTDERGELPPLATDALPADRVMRLTPGGLSLGAMRELLHQRLAFTPSHQLLVRVHEVSRGNPFFAIELARALEEHTGELGEQLPVPSTLRRLVHGRVARLPRRVREVLLAAALVPSGSLAMLDASLPEPAAAYLETAEEAGVVELASGRVVFTHPLLRSVVVGDAPARERREAHRRLANAAAAPSERARHLARAAEGPDGAVAAALDDAARDARLQGAVESAAELGELAIALTPPADRSELGRRKLAAAEYQFECGNPARARDLVAAIAVSGVALARLAKYQRYCGDPMAIWTETLQRALEVADDDRVRIALHLDLGMAAMNAGDFAGVAQHMGALSGLAERANDRFTLARLASARVYVDFTNGLGISEELVAQSLAEPTERLAIEVRPTYNLAVAFTLAGLLDRARELLDREFAEVLAHGDEPSLPIVLSVLSRVEAWAGNVQRSVDLADQGMAAARYSDMPVGIGFMAAARATVHSYLGDIEQVHDDCATAIAIGTELSLAPLVLPAVEAAAQLELSRGDPSAALDHLAPYLDAVPTVEPGLARIVPEAAESLVRLGRLDEAERRLAPFESCAAALDRGWAIAAAARVRGLLHAAHGQFDAAEAVLDRAEEHAEACGMPLERARTHLVAGEVQRRARHKRQANDQLVIAKAEFDALGARLWSARCDDELARARLGAPAVADPQSLTETEQRVAELAAQGRTSREIAAALFTGVRTVEAHLQRVYRKLGVHSRVELSRRFRP